MANIYVRSTDGSDVDDGSTWALAKATLVGALAIATNADTIWVSDNHAETQATNMTLTCPTSQGLRILCGDDAAEPPTALATTATISTTGNTTLLIAGHAYIYGITFSDGSGNSGAAALGICAGLLSAALFFDTCGFVQGSTNAGALFRIGISGAGSSNADDAQVVLKSCSFKFGATGQVIQLSGGCRSHIINMSIDAAGSTPTSLFTFVGGIGNEHKCMVEASDLSGEAFTNLVASANIAIGSMLEVRNCKIPASMVVVGTANAQGPGGPIVKMHNCDSADTNYRFAEHYYEGSIVQETTIVRTGGASDGTTGLSAKMVSSANTKFWDPFVTYLIPFWNETVGSAISVETEFIHDSVTNLQDDEIWQEVQYLGTSGVPLGTIASDRMTNILSTPADQTDSSVTWTTTGLTNPNTQKLVSSITCQEKGWVFVSVHLANPSYTVYVDGKVAPAGSGRQALAPGLGYINMDAAAAGGGGLLTNPGMGGGMRG